MLCIMVFIKSKRYGWKGDTQRASLKEIGRLFLDTIWGLLSPRVTLNSPAAIGSLKELIALKEYSDPKYCSWWTNTATTFAGRRKYVKE